MAVLSCEITLESIKHSKQLLRKSIKFSVSIIEKLYFDQVSQYISVEVNLLNLITFF